MNVESISGFHVDKDDPKAIEKVAKEMESVFIYELLKVMRQSLKSDEFGNGMYTELMDMELSREMAGRGVGLREMIEKQLSKYQQADTGQGSTETMRTEELKPLNHMDKYNELKKTLETSEKRRVDILGGGV